MDLSDDFSCRHKTSFIGFIDDGSCHSDGSRSCMILETRKTDINFQCQQNKTDCKNERLQGQQSEKGLYQILSHILMVGSGCQTQKERGVGSASQNIDNRI